MKNIIIDGQEFNLVPVKKEENKKEYEILSFSVKNNINRIFEKVEDRYAAYKCRIDEGFIAKNSLELAPKSIDSMFNIYSVKRLSDGEVFTIGDSICSESWTRVNSNSIDKDWNILTKITISDIQLQKDFSTFEIGKIVLQTKITYQTLLDTALKAKQPLFTTEDGVDIFEKDNYYFVVVSDNPILDPWRARKSSVTWKVSDKYSPLGHKQFSTKEAAEEYILLNKPCLSVNDIYSVRETVKGESHLEKLKTLAREKL